MGTDTERQHTYLPTCSAMVSPLGKGKLLLTIHAVRSLGVWHPRGLLWTQILCLVSWRIRTLSWVWWRLWKLVMAIIGIILLIRRGFTVISHLCWEKLASHSLQKGLAHRVQHSRFCVFQLEAERFGWTTALVSPHRNLTLGWGCKLTESQQGWLHFHG